METGTDEGEQAAQQPTTSEEVATSPQPMEDQGIDHPGIGMTSTCIHSLTSPLPHFSTPSPLHSLTSLLPYLSTPSPPLPHLSTSSPFHSLTSPLPHLSTPSPPLPHLSTPSPPLPHLHSLTSTPSPLHSLISTPSTSPGLLIQLQSPSPHTPQPQPLEDIVEEEEEEESIDRETLMQELKVSRLCPTYPHFFTLTPSLLYPLPLSLSLFLWFNTILFLCCYRRH